LVVWEERGETGRRGWEKEMGRRGMGMEEWRERGTDKLVETKSPPRR